MKAKMKGRICKPTYFLFVIHSACAIYISHPATLNSLNNQLNNQHNNQHNNQLNNQHNNQHNNQLNNQPNNQHNNQHNNPPATIIDNTFIYFYNYSKTNVPSNNFFNNYNPNTHHINKHRRLKRQATLNLQTYVIPHNTGLNTALLTTSKTLTTFSNIQYTILNNTVVGVNLMGREVIRDQKMFEINSKNGVIVSKVDLALEGFQSLELTVEMLRDSIAESRQPIRIKLVETELDQPAFINQPRPIWTTIGVWNRPNEPIITLQSRHAIIHSSHDVTYVMTHGDRNTFGVNAATGDVFINTRKQFIVDDVYTLVVSAQSHGTRLATSAAVAAATGSTMLSWIPAAAQSINIKVGNKEPQFHSTPFLLNFLENATVGQKIGQVAATSFQKLPLTFSMSPSSSLFSLDGNSGDVTLNSKLTYIKNDRQYVHDVKVIEMHSNFESTTKLIFKLHSANHPPSFPVQYYVKYNVPENTAVKTKLLELLVREYDPGEMGRLEVTTSHSVFDVVEVDGVISLTVARPLSYELLPLQRYDVVVSATDHGWPRLTATANVQIFVDNTNDKSPVFEPEGQIITVQEGARKGLIVHHIQAYDPDGDGIKFTFNKEPLTQEYFNVDENSGQITLIKNIEPGQNDLVFFNLSIIITDDSTCCPGKSSPPLSTLGYVGINVYRVNTQPTFPNCRLYSPTVKENSKGFTLSILTLLAKDEDKGLNGQLRFRIFGEEKNYFRVKPKPTGNEVELYLTQPISRESAGVLQFNNTFKYPVVVKAVDQGIPALSANCFLFVTIETINLKAPRFDYGEQNAYYNVNPGVIGDRIGRVFAFDTDYGANGVVSYAFLNVSGSDYDSCVSFFNLESSTGWITWKADPTAPLKTYQCYVQATDNGTPKQSSTSTISIQLTNKQLLKPPSWDPIRNTDIDSLDFSIAENQELETEILKLTATIPYDSNIEFFLPSESIDVFNGNGWFGINSNSSNNRGQMSIVLKKTLPEANLAPLYFLRCRAFVTSIVNPGISLYSIGRLQVKITDVNNQPPMFLGMDSNGVYTAAVTQFTIGGDFVVVVTAVDGDKSWPNNKVSYSIQSGEGSQHFSINSDSGVVSVSTTATSASGVPIFDPNVKAFYEIVVFAQDGADSAIPAVVGPNKVQVKVQIIVNGGRSSSPSFDRTFSTSISEVLPRFRTVINATASLPTNLPVGNVELTQYNIRGGNVGRVFAVDIHNGTVYKVGELNAEIKSFYQLKYTAFDGIRIIGPVDVNVTVTRSDFRAVVFAKSVYDYAGPVITEKDSASIGTTLATVTTKGTLNNNQQITYSLSDPINYSIDQSGVVKLSQPLSRDVPDGYAPQQVNVKADAGGYSPGYALVTLDVKDINDNKPIFDPCCVSGFVAENTVGNAFQLKTFDADAGVNRESTFSIVGDSDSIEVASDGWVKAKKTLDFEEKQMYSVKVRATDKGSPPLSSETDIYIYVKDISEFAPSFPNSSYDVRIDEELPVGAIVTSLKAEDDDPMDNITYSLLGNSGNEDYKFFYVENSRVFDGSYETNNARIISTGVVRMAKRLDYDVSKKASYDFVVRAEDTGSRVASTVVKVTASDVNDNAPLILPPITSSLLTGSDAVGKNVASFSASDLDSGVNGEFSFSLDHHNTDPMYNFQIDPKNGQVSILNPFTPETPLSIMLTVMAIDKGTPAMTGTAVVNITIADLQVPPTPTLLNPYPVVINPNAAKNSVVYCLDNNNNNNNNYNYELDCADAQNCDDFTMSEQGCLVANRNGYSRKELDYNNYNIPVKISNKDNNNNEDLITRQNIKLVMQGTTDTAPQTGVKMVHVVNYVDVEGGYSTMPLGNVYVRDVDDWDLHLKTFTLKTGMPFFSLNQDHPGKLFLRGDITPGVHEAEVEVKDTSYPVAIAKVVAEVSLVNKTALDNSASMRISGLTDVSDLLRVPVNSDKTRLDSIKNILKTAVGDKASVEVLSMGNFNYEMTDADTDNAGGDSSVGRQVMIGDENTNKENLVDVLFAVRSDSAYHSPESLNFMVNSKKSEIEKAADVKLLMVPVDMCRSEFYQCWKDGCVTTPALLSKQPRLINTNQTSFVGLSVDLQQKCIGKVEEVGMVEKDGVVKCLSGYCLNSGVCVPANAVVKCVCPPGFDGQRCQKTSVSFTDQGGYMLLPPLQQNATLHLSLHILIPTSSPSDTLLLYSGPTQTPSQSSEMIISSYDDNQVKEFVQQDFLLLELSNGKPRLRVDFGDGEVKVELLGNQVGSLSDGKWHALDVIIDEKNVRLMIDNCKTAPITENIASSTMDTSLCSASVERPGDRFLISTGGFPLQLGGRIDDTTAYPLNWVKGRLRGCVKNLMVNSQLYDLSIGEHRAYQSAESDCRYEECTSCPSNSSCRVLGPPGSPVCHCPPGFKGTQCQTATATRYYTSNEFVQWKPTEMFVRQLNSSQNWYSDNFQLMFRTRQTDGVLFTVKSFTNLERYILELIDGVPHFKYDLGSNDDVVSLNGVKVDDGSWHWIRAERHGNQAELRLDDGQGAKYSSTFPTNKHRNIKFFSANVLGELEYNEWTKETTTDHNLEKTCISDVRYNGNLLSLTTTSSFFTVSSQGGSDEGCDKSGACAGQNCPSGTVCVDLWQDSECRCEKFFLPSSSDVPNADCISKSCFKSPCLNGATCSIVAGNVVCICPKGFSGLLCEVDEVKKGSTKQRNFNLAAAIILPILLILLLLCLLLLLLWWCCCRNRERGLLYDEPDKDTRENVISYDDEGAGEEDNYGFDLGRLQKSNMETENVKKSFDFDAIAPSFTVPNKCEAPTSGLPGNYSNVADFISDRMNDVDADPDNTNDDTQMLFESEGEGSEAGTLSTLASSLANEDMDWLGNAGPRFGRLADMYGENV